MDAASPVYPCAVVVPRRPAAYLVVPAITLAVACLLLVALATPRTLVAVRLWGGPTAEGPQALRLQCVRRAVGVEDGVPIEGLVVELEGARLPASCGVHGHGEIAIAPGRSGGFPVRVLRGAEALAEGEARVTEARWLSGAAPLPARVPSSGTLPVRVNVVGGSLLLERWGEVLLEVPEELRPPGKLKLGASGLELGPRSPHPRGLRLRLRPTFFTAILDADDGAGIAWEAHLPVRMSGVAVEGLTLADGVVKGHLRSTTAAPVAYLQVQDQRGRLAAAAIPLARDDRGGAHGPFALPVPPLRGDAWLLTSTSPQPSEDGAIPWSLTPDALDGRVVPDVLWVDGMAPAVQREAARMQRHLGAVGAVVLLGAIAEALLLYERARAARLDFQRHLASLGEGAQEEHLVEAHGALRFALGAALVLFGFAVLGALLVAKIG
jgi:hypothetical protein